MNGLRRNLTVSMALSLGLLAACGGSESSAPGAATAASGASASPETSSPSVATAAPTAPTTPVAPTTTLPATTRPPTTLPAAPQTTAPPIVDQAAVTQEALQNSWLYQVGPLPSAGCPAASQVELGTVDGLRAFYESVVGCLNTAWGQIDPELTPALLVVFSGPAPAESCGAGVEYSFYCPGDGTIYMYADEINQPWNDYAGDDFSHGITRLAATWVIGHEYGHHLQNVVGIFDAMEPDWPGTELERRLELQASCLADVFMASQADAYPVSPEYWEWQQNWRGTRLANHGSPENHLIWVDRGYQSKDPGACNTWVAPPAEVA